ncbi:hypothetical protein XENTR_v10024171 [Xenopus tropicalis]|nr:hypothetical protein XENTR_v10024171 [Xenopus tropicalis]
MVLNILGPFQQRSLPQALSSGPQFPPLCHVTCSPKWPQEYPSFHLILCFFPPHKRYCVVMSFLEVCCNIVLMHLCSSLYVFLFLHFLSLLVLRWGNS